MPKFDEFDLDVKSGVNGDGDDTKITSKLLCTPGTCHKNCNKTSTLNTNCCITVTCITCV